MNESVEWNADFINTGNGGLSVDISPSVFTLEPGETRQITFRANITEIPLDPTAAMFGELTFTPNTNLPQLHMPVAIRWKSRGVGIAVNSHSLNEGESTTARVFRTSNSISKELTVDITVSEEGQLDITTTATIPAGEVFSEPFTITALKDEVAETEHEVTLTVSANSHRRGEQSMTILDHDDVIGDFNLDGLVDVADIDVLAAAIAAGSDDAKLDINSDEIVNELDLDYLLTEGLITAGNRVKGDADFDGTVAFADFLRLSRKFGESGLWSDGDFDASGKVDFADFLILSTNFGEKGQSIVP